MTKSARSTFTTRDNGQVGAATSSPARPAGGHPDRWARARPPAVRPRPRPQPIPTQPRMTCPDAIHQAPFRLVGAARRCCAMTGDAQPSDVEERDTQRELSALRLMAEVSQVLGSSLDSEDVLRRLARLMAPELADWCSVGLLDGDLRRVAVVHRDPEVVLPPGAEGVLPDPDPLSGSPVERVLVGEGPLVVTQA